MKIFRFIILTGWLLCPDDCPAQFKLGFYGGVNVTNENTPTLESQANLYTDSVVKYTKSGSDVNYYAGVNSELNISPSLTLQLNLLYSVKGYSRSTVLLDSVQNPNGLISYRLASSAQSDFR